MHEKALNYLYTRNLYTLKILQIDLNIYVQLFLCLFEYLYDHLLYIW